MFCLGCGSEITRRAEFCPVCGQRIGEAPRAAASVASARASLPLPPAPARPAPPSSPGSPWRSAPGATSSTTAIAYGERGDPYAQANDTEQSLSEPSTPSTAATAADASDTAPRISAMRPPAPSSALAGLGSIRWGDLDGPAFPRDAAGRGALVAAVALVVSLFLPWINVFARSISPAHLGLPAWGVIATAILAAAPTFWGPRRRRQLAAVATFGIGAVLLGGGLLAWLLFGPLAPQISSDFIVIMGGPGVSEGGQNPISVGAGLYLFLLSAAGLTVAGYRLLMDALGAQQGSVVTQPAPPAYSANPTSTASAGSTAPAAPLAGAQASQAPTPVAPPAQTTPAGAPLRPGDPRWDEATAPPTVVRRPAYGGGWGRGGVSRR